MLLGVSIATLIIILDQVSKLFVSDYLVKDGGFVQYFSFFNLVYAWNTGVSFSMFNNHGAIGAIILSVVAIGVVIGLLWWLYNEKEKIIVIALGCIIGGALGNVIDRLRFGAVFDFLDFHYKSYHWPAFNVADSFIFIGACVIAIHSIFFSSNNKI